MSNIGVLIREYDQSQVQEIFDSVGNTQQFVIKQTKGFGNKPVLIKNQKEFMEIFGTQNPDVTGHISSLIQYNFVQSYPQYVMRVLSDDQRYQGQGFNLDELGSVGVQLDSNSSPSNLEQFSMSNDINFTVFQKYPGEWGNNLKVKVEPIKMFNSLEYNQLRVTVLDEDNIPLEVFEVSEDINVVDELGNSLYIEDVINERSKTIYVLNNLTKNFDFSTFVSTPTSQTYSTTQDGNTTTFTFTDTDGYDITDVTEVRINGSIVPETDYSLSISVDKKTVTISFNVQPQINDQVTIDYTKIVTPDQSKLTTEVVLGGGSDGSEITDEIIQQRVQIYEDDEEYDYNYIVSQGWTNPLIHSQMVGVQEKTKSVQLLDLSNQKSQDQFIDERNGQQIDSSYQQYFAPWLIQKNPYTNRMMEVPPTFYVQRKFFEIDGSQGTSQPVQGELFGTINQVDVTIKFTKDERNQLDSQKINPIQKLKNKGIFIYGNNTLQSYNSKLSDLHQRRILQFELYKWQKRELTRYTFRKITDDLLEELNDLMSDKVRTMLNGGYQENMSYKLIQTPDYINQRKVGIRVTITPVGYLKTIEFEVVVTSSGVEIQEQ